MRLPVSFPADRPVLLAAAVTPLAPGGDRLDESAIGPYVAFLRRHGADGVFACGTTGEGVLLTLDERRRATAAFRAGLDAADGGTLIVHAGAQTTADTAALAAHAAEAGADGVAVIAPPYFALDADALTAHFVAAAAACTPLPFFCYAFAARSGYPLPVEVIERIAAAAPNLAGLKVSESPYERVAPYIGLGLPVLIGNEPLIPAGLADGAIGSVSGMAAAFPDVVRAALDEPNDAAAERLRALRAALDGSGQFVAAAKRALHLRGVAVGSDVRAPLRALHAAEVAALSTELGAFITQ